MKGRLIPNDIDVEVTRDYGETANDKANELLFHLALATVSIVMLIGFAIGRREALVTLVVIPTTILLTLFAAELMGYTINRVSLFALIFSIGILVDDAIVVVENIARHWAMKDGRDRMQAAIEAVAEVGNPTVVATLDRDRGAAADAVRLRADGPLYGADPGQRLGGHAVLLLRRDGDRALADAASWRRSEAPARAATMPRMAKACSARFIAALLRRSCARAARPGYSWSRSASRRFSSASCSRPRASRSSCCRSTTSPNSTWCVDLPEGASLEDTERTLVRRRRDRAADCRKSLDPGLCRHAGAVQFQRPGAALLSCRELPELGELQVNLVAPKATATARATTIALDLRRD